MKSNKNIYLDFKNFVDISNKIFHIFSNSEIAYSPLLSISKPIPEIIKKKQKLIKAVIKESYYTYILTFIPRIFINLIVSIIHHVYYLHQYRKFSLQKLHKTEVVFLSHYTGNKTISFEDPYFGLLPQQLNKSNKPNLILYINHTNDNPSYCYLNNDAQDSNCEKYVLPKTIKTSQFLRLYMGKLKNFKEVMFFMIKNEKINMSEKILLIELAIQQLGWESILQSTLAKNIELIVEKINARKVVLTYEGHSFEIFVANKLQSIYPNLDVFVYQFAPIVPAQNSFFRNLHYLNKNIGIFVSGSKFKSSILNRTRLDGSTIKVIGSRKNISEELVPIAKKETTVLFAAEGSRDSLTEFINLAFSCAKNNPNATFVVRAHPASGSYKSELFKKLKKMSSNIYLSRDSLINDLHKATFCVYRSSSVGLEGLRHGVIPIHYDTVTDIGLDPIDTIDLPHLQVTCAVTLNQKITELLNNYVEVDEQQLRTYKKVFNGYFEPLQLGVLN